MKAIPLDPWLDHLEAHLPVAREGRDPEGVHQLRVALGRIDLWLRAAGWRALRDDVRWLRREAARMRDLDVQLAADPPPAWERILRRERERTRAQFLERLEDPRVPGLLEALHLVPPLERGNLEEVLELQRRRVKRRGRDLEADRKGLERYHDLRRAVRRLRYALEWAGLSTRPLKDMQEALGELNDAAVTLDLLEELDGEAELSEFRARHVARLEALRRTTLKAWRASELAQER